MFHSKKTKKKSLPDRPYKKSLLNKTLLFLGGYAFFLISTISVSVYYIASRLKTIDQSLLEFEELTHEVETVNELQEYLKLDWIYQDLAESSAADLGTKPTAVQTLIAPPREEIEILYELAMLGNMKKIRQRAIYLAELDQQYASFATKLQDLARGFQEKAIVNLVEQYLTHE